MIHSMMLLAMARSTKRKQVFERIVSLFFRCCRSFAVNMMNMQVVISSAVLACVAIPLKGFFSIAPKVVIIFGGFLVFCKAIFVRQKPFVNLAYFVSLLAFFASFLWARFVFKIRAAVGTLNNCANRHFSLFPSKLSKRLDIFHLPEFWFAWFASLLNGTSWLIQLVTDFASSCLKWHNFTSSRNIHILTWVRKYG